MALLANRDSDGSLHCSAHVTTKGMAGNIKEIAEVIAGRVWEVTGYRFTFVDSEYNANRIHR